MKKTVYTVLNKEPKDKAKELVESFKPIVYPFSGSGFMTYAVDDDVVLENAKKCAMKVADECFEEATRWEGSFMGQKRVKFWAEVINEIEKYEK